MRLGDTPVSTEDIETGDRGLSRIEELLNNSEFGILCVTKENYKAPWLLFEAGALSNNPNKVRVVPFLFGLTPSDLTGSPIIQFQATAYSDKESIRKLIYSLNLARGEMKLDDTLLEKLFERRYPDLSDALAEVYNGESEVDNESKIDVDKNIVILEELLEITRNNQKALSKDSLLEGISYDRIRHLIKDSLEEFGKDMYFPCLASENGNAECKIIIEYNMNDDRGTISKNLAF